ncbi:oxidoreductase, partial [Verrucosispora sp. SN26_14.1]
MTARRGRLLAVVTSVVVALAVSAFVLRDGDRPVPPAPAPAAAADPVSYTNSEPT